MRPEVLAAAALAVLVAAPAGAGGGESCIECHLHRSIVQESAPGGGAPRTLAGLHGRVAAGGGPACRACHGERQDAGERPAAQACIACHTRGRTAQGDPRLSFHAAPAHWLAGARVSCIDCHRGHAVGNRAVKFLAADAVGICAGCHERSFNMGVGGAPSDDAQD